MTGRMTGHFLQPTALADAPSGVSEAEARCSGTNGLHNIKKRAEETFPPPWGSLQPGDDQLCRYGLGAAGSGRQRDGIGCAFGIAHRQYGIRCGGFDQRCPYDLRAAGIPSGYGVGQLLAVQGQRQLTGFGGGGSKLHLIHTGLCQNKGVIRRASDARTAGRTVPGEADICAGSNGIRVIRRHQGIETGKVQHCSGRTRFALGSLGTNGTCFALRTLRSDLSLGTLRTNGTLGTNGTDLSLRSLGTGRPLRTGRPGFTLGSLRTDGTGNSRSTLGTGRSGNAGRTLHTLGTRCALRSLGTGQSPWPGDTLGTLRTPRSNRTSGTLRTLRTLRSGRTYAAAAPIRTAAIAYRVALAGIVVKLGGAASFVVTVSRQSNHSFFSIVTVYARSKKLPPIAT